MTRFLRDMNKFFIAIGDLTETNAWIKFQAIVLRTFNKIKNRTPVDTGFAKSSWRVEINHDTPGLFQAKIYNGAWYIALLEYGHSKQAPQGMVRITLIEQSITIRRILKGLSRGR